MGFLFGVLVSQLELPKPWSQEEDLEFEKFYGCSYMFNGGVGPRGIEEPSGLTGACICSTTYLSSAWVYSSMFLQV